MTEKLLTNWDMKHQCKEKTTKSGQYCLQYRLSYYVSRWESRQQLLWKAGSGCKSRKGSALTMYCWVIDNCLEVSYQINYLSQYTRSQYSGKPVGLGSLGSASKNGSSYQSYKGADKIVDVQTDLCLLFDLILYVPSTIFQLYRDGSSWVEPVLS